MEKKSKFYLKELPTTERPRERLISKGAKSLTDYELLAIILRTGSSDLSVLELSKYVLINEGNLSSFNDITIEELKKYKGISTAKAVEVIAAIEFGQRVFKYHEQKTRIKNSKDIFEYAHIDMENLKNEVVRVICLNIKGEIITSKEIQSGGNDRVVLDYIELYKLCIKNSCKHFALIHNHPSGDPAPSINDKEITKYVYSNAQTLGITLIDHVIIGKGKYYSFMENKIYVHE